MASRDVNTSSTSSGSLNSSGGGSDRSGLGVGVDLTCPVCRDTFRVPRFLPCHHTLCTDCISDLMERAPPPATHFPCPLCQGSVPVPQDGVTSFQVNFYLAPLLSGAVLSQSGPQQPTPVDSGVCGPAGEEGGRPSATPTGLDPSCRAHWPSPGSEGAAPHYYCRPCASLVCSPSCPLHPPPHHTVTHVGEEAPAHRSEVRRQLLSLSTFQGALADLEDECTQRVAALDDSCRQVVQKVASTRQQACDAISTRADKASEKVQSLKGRIGKVVEGERRSIQEKRTALSALLTSASHVMEADDAEFLRQKTKLMARIQSVMSKVPPSRGHLRFSFRTSPALTSLVARDSSLGYMTVQFQSPVLRHRLTLSSTKQQRKLRKLCPRGDGSMLAAVGNCLVTITADLSETKRLEFPGEVVDFVPARDGFVYVALPFPHAVKRLNTATSMATDFVSPLNPPTALAATDKRELVLAAQDGKELSLTFYHSDSGERLKRLTLPRPEFTPLALALTKQGRLFLCSSSEVLVLDTDFGQLGGLGPGDSTLQPRGVTGLRGMGSGLGDVLMANAAAGNVEVLEVAEDGLRRREEVIQWKRGTTDEDADLSKGLIERISCAVLDQSGTLWVGQEDGHVSVYDWLLRTT
ncbi:uncharacterized protein LOC143291052 [Babylonia areolata]|uniref:uncharacterized protein LOC143291052 n=1 Tax=Babylonia areolata TaxID=304850 RepID=UPI003FD41465